MTQISITFYSKSSVSLIPIPQNLTITLNFTSYNNEGESTFTTYQQGTNSSFPGGLLANTITGINFTFTPSTTTKRQTRALLSLLDPRGKHIDYKNQEKIANESGKIAAHVVSVSEGIKLIGNALAKR